MLGGTSHRDIPLAPAAPREKKSVLYFFRLLSWATTPLLSFALSSLLRFLHLRSTLHSFEFDTRSLLLLCRHSLQHSNYSSFYFHSEKSAQYLPQLVLEFLLKQQIAVYHPQQQQCADFQFQQPYLRPSSFCRRSSVPNPTALMHLWLDDICTLTTRDTDW